MSTLGPVNSIKDGSGYVPLLLAVFTFQVDSGTAPTLLVSTHPLNTAEGGHSFPGVGILPAGDYLARVSAQDIPALQQRSQQGIDRIAQVTLNLFDADAFIWTNYCFDDTGGRGFRGASLQLALVLWQVGTSNFTSDAPIQFVGTCDMEVPTDGGKNIRVTANNSHNTARINLPQFPIQTRCPLRFPSNSDERDATLDPSSRLCIYSADKTGGYGNLATTGGPSNDGRNVVDAYGNLITDNNRVYIRCDFLRSDPTRINLNVGCMARLGNYASTGVAPDGDLSHSTTNNADGVSKQTGGFAGVEWSPSSYYQITRNYVNQNSQASFSFINGAVLGLFHNMLYGQQWVDCKIANVIESGNDTQVEAMVCTGGSIGQGVTPQVIVNGIIVPHITSPSNPGSTDPNLWWGHVNEGGRRGLALGGPGYSSSSHSALGDPYGSIACLRVVFYSSISTGTAVPTVRVLVLGPLLYKYTPSGGGSFSQSLGNLYDSRNPSWVLSDILGKSNWSLDEIGLQSFYDCSFYYSSTIGYIDQSGNLQTHERFAIQFCLQARRPAAEIIAGILKACNSYMYWDATGKIQLAFNGTLSDTQPSPISGSNYNTPFPSTTAQFKDTWSAIYQYVVNDVVYLSGVYYTSLSGTSYLDANVGNNPTSSPSYWSVRSAPVGYPAYSFDESNVNRVGSVDNIRPEFDGEASTTSQTPNQFYVKFQDMDNGYVDDSIGEIDVPASDRSAGALQPGGALIPESVSQYGISNFDQGIRVINTFSAERQYGNEANDARGTRTFVIGTTVRCAHLRVGHLVLFSWQKYGISNQLFRVIKIAPTTDFMQCKLTIQWHNDLWYEDSFGQAPQAYYSATHRGPANRVPLPWQPGTGSTVSWLDGTPFKVSFAVKEDNKTQTDLSNLVTVVVIGNLPRNTNNTVPQPPRVPIQASTSATGGFIPGGFQYFIKLTAFDAGGNESATSTVISVFVPSGTDTNTITVSNISWDGTTSSCKVYMGTDELNISEQQTFTSPTSIVVATAYSASLFSAPPDPSAQSIKLMAKFVPHAGIIGAQVSSLASFQITLGAPPSGSFSTSLAGYWVLLIGRSASGISPSLLPFKVTSNSVGGSNTTVLNVDHAGLNPNSVLSSLDVMVVCLQANISSANTIGDSNYANVYNLGIGFISADVGRTVRIIGGKGEYQIRTIEAVISSTTVRLDKDWVVIPDSTSLWIVEDSSWQDNSVTTQFQNSGTANTQLNGLNFPNLANQTILVQGLTVNANGSLTSPPERSPFRILYVFGGPGQTGPTYYTIPIIAGVATIDLKNGPKQRVAMNGTPFSFSTPINSDPNTGGVVKQGAGLILYLDQITANNPIPTCPTGATAFQSDIMSRIQMDGTINTRTTLTMSYHGPWSIESQTTGGSIT